MNVSARWQLTLVAALLLMPRPSTANDSKAANEAIARGKTCVANGDFEAAVAAFTEAIRLDASNALAYYYRGRILDQGEEKVSGTIFGAQRGETPETKVPGPFSPSQFPSGTDVQIWTGSGYNTFRSNGQAWAGGTPVITPQRGIFAEPSQQFTLTIPGVTGSPADSTYSLSNPPSPSATRPAALGTSAG